MDSAFYLPLDTRDAPPLSAPSGPTLQSLQLTIGMPHGVAPQGPPPPPPPPVGAAAASAVDGLVGVVVPDVHLGGLIGDDLDSADGDAPSQPPPQPQQAQAQAQEPRQGPAAEQRKPFDCSLCGRGYGSRSALLSHQRKRHPDFVPAEKRPPHPEAIEMVRAALLHEIKRALHVSSAPRASEPANYQVQWRTVSVPCPVKVYEHVFRGKGKETRHPRRGRYQNVFGEPEELDFFLGQGWWERYFHKACTFVLRLNPYSEARERLPITVKCHVHTVQDYAVFSAAAEAAGGKPVILKAHHSQAFLSLRFAVETEFVDMQFARPDQNGPNLSDTHSE